MTYGLRKAKFSNCSGWVRTWLAYKLAPSLTKIMMVNNMKAVPYSIDVKKGSRKTQKAIL